MWRFVRELFGASRPAQYPSYEETAALLGPRYREVETPFGTIAYLTPALDLADGGMGASWEFSFERDILMPWSNGQRATPAECPSCREGSPRPWECTCALEDGEPATDGTTKP